MKLVDEAVLAWFRGLTCELCHSRPGEPHHILTRGMGGGGRIDHPFNIVSVCRVCHERIHATGEPTAHDLTEFVATREGVSYHTVFEFLAWFRRQDKNRPIGVTPWNKSSLSSR